MKFWITSYGFGRRWMRRFFVWMFLSCWLWVSVTPVHAQRAAENVAAAEPLQAGRVAYRAGRFYEAQQLWEQALLRAQERGSRWEQATALSNLALAQIQLGNYPAAERQLNRATQIQRNAGASPQRLTETQAHIAAQILSTEAQLHRAQGHYPLALEALERADNLYQQLDNPTHRLRNRLNQSELLRLSGLYPQALNRLESVSTLLESQPDTPFTAATLRQLGVLLDQLAARSSSGICSTAQDCLEASLAVAQRSRSDAEQALSLIALSAQQSDWRRAEQFLLRAIALPVSPEIQLQARVHLVQRLVQRQLTPPRPTAATRHRIARQQQRIEDPDGDFQRMLRDQLDWSLRLLPQLPPSRSKFRLQANLAAQLLALTTAQRPAQISAQNPVASERSLEDLLNSLLQEARSLRDRQFESYALGYLGQLAEDRLSRADALAERKRQLTEAQQLTAAALDQSETANLGFLSYQWLWQQGRLLQRERELLPPDSVRQRQRLLGQALTIYEMAVGQLNLLRGDLININRQNRLEFRQRIKPIYQEFIRLLIEADQQNLPPELAQNLAQNLSQPPGQKLRTKQGKKQTASYLSQAMQVADSLQVAELTNFFRADCQLASQIQVEQIDPKAAVIYPLVSDNAVEVIVGLPTFTDRTMSQWTYHRTEVALAEFDQSLSTYRNLVSSRGSTCKQAVFDSVDQGSPRNCSRSAAAEVQSIGMQTPEEARNAIEQLQATLYDMLIRPFEAEFEASGVETLLFISSGQLQNIPMAVLYDRERQEYLIDRYAIATSPSLQLLDSRPLSPRNVQAILAGLTLEREDFEPLEFVRPEIEQIQAQTLNSQALLGEEFTQANLEAKVSQLSYPIVHLATHGVFGSTLEDTYIVTADDALNANELSALLQGKGLGSNPPIELLVLSACETARGDELAALGLSGIAVRSGARSTVGSLWLVNDESTARLMQRFYYELARGGVSRAQALRLAQLHLKNSEDLDMSDPYYWAAFVLVGNWT